jgi:hypothetical protein
MKEVTDATLTKTQKNRILEVVRKYGPPADNFNWTEREQEEYCNMSLWPFSVSVLEHRPTGYFCIFGAHSVTTSPGIKKKVEGFRHEDNWGTKENACGRWLVDLKVEVEAPDLWSTIGEEKALSTAASSSLDNRPFTASEQKLIGTKLEEIKAYLLQAQPFAAEQAATIEREFAYLKESAERMGRKDWLNILLGGLFGLAVTLSLEPEKAKGLLRLAATVLQSLWGMAQGYLT